MTPQEANVLLTAAKRHDYLVVDTEEAASTWARALGPRRRPDGTHDEGIPYRAGELIIQDYYGMHTDPQNRKPIDASFIRKLYHSKTRELESQHRAINPPARKLKKGPPRWYVLEQRAKGRMQDADPLDFEDRPRP